MCELHCGTCFKILAEGESPYMKEKSAELPCVRCGDFNRPNDWLTTAQVVEAIGDEAPGHRRWRPDTGIIQINKDC